MHLQACNYTDTEILDFLQKMLDKKKHTGKCVCRMSPYGYGLVLFETQRKEGRQSVREAVVEYMNNNAEVI